MAATKQMDKESDREAHFCAKFGLSKKIAAE
jgi:hypothetical protein